MAQNCLELKLNSPIIIKTIPTTYLLMISHIKRKVRKRSKKWVGNAVKQKDKYNLPLLSRSEIMQYNETALHQVLLDHVVKTTFISTFQQGIFMPYVKEIDKIIRTYKRKALTLRIDACIEKWSDTKGKYKMDKKILKMLLKEVQLLNSPEAE